MACLWDWITTIFSLVPLNLWWVPCWINKWTNSGYPTWAIKSLRVKLNASPGHVKSRSSYSLCFLATPILSWALRLDSVEKSDAKRIDCKSSKFHVRGLSFRLIIFLQISEIIEYSISYPQLIFSALKRFFKLKNQGFCSEMPYTFLAYLCLYITAHLLIAPNKCSGQHLHWRL